MPEYKQHVLVCDVVRDDGRRCGNKGGGNVKKKFAEVLAANDLSSEVYVSSVGCTSQHGLCEMEQASILIYGKNNQGTWYIADDNDVEQIVEEHIINGNIVESLLNENMKVRLDN
ncbi:MAG: (2Fe-2S) ferredoxin domain-containing protein [SAR202 cluster bacterium]|nr:2Fe-2S ferredoxin [Chloroflexota bacterium]MQG50902.1 (2Fe-2S) ferredoxin domain-containing protein [SAR202 cluster bacterium]|tara:strand:- start:6242 stop:6586 length:345 start_codon:yes stop_codon:yes gene_type:complete